MQGLQETMYACLQVTWDSYYQNSRPLNRSTIVLECWYSIAINLKLFK